MVEVEALLVTVTLPVCVPVLAGVKVTFSVAMSPGFRIVPVGMPLAVKPGPEMLMVSMVTAEPVLFVKLTETVLLSPRATLPRLRLEVLGPNCPALVMASFDARVVVPEQPVWQIAPIPAAMSRNRLARFRWARKGRALQHRNLLQEKLLAGRTVPEQVVTYP
jgi:hypothetical protein